VNGRGPIHVSRGPSCRGPIASSCAGPAAIVASQRRPASLTGRVPSATGGEPGVNPKASMTSPLSARHSQVRRAMSGCGISSDKAPPASGRPSTSRWAPSSANSRSAPVLSAAASTSQERVEESCITRSWVDAPFLSRLTLKVRHRSRTAEASEGPPLRAAGDPNSNQHLCWSIIDAGISATGRDGEPAQVMRPAGIVTRALRLVGKAALGHAQ